MRKTLYVLLLVLHGLVKGADFDLGCNDETLRAGGARQETNMQGAHMRGTFITYFRSDKAIPDMFPLLKARIPIYWSEFRGNAFDPPRITGDQEDQYSFFIEEVEKHPGIFYLRLRYDSAVDAAKYDWEGQKRLILKTLGAEEVPGFDPNA